MKNQEATQHGSTTDDLVTCSWKAGVDIQVILIGDDCPVRVINEAGSGNCADHAPAHETLTQQTGTDKTDKERN